MTNTSNPQHSNHQNKELNRLKMVQSELVVLQESLGLEKTKSFSPIISRITIRSITGWWQGFEIRKGRSNYLKDGMGVIFEVESLAN